MNIAKEFHAFSHLCLSSALALALGCAPDLPDHPDAECKNVAAGELVVTEFMADPAGSDTGKQYIEVYNTTDHVIDLTGLSLFQSLSDGSRLNATVLPRVQIPAHAFFVLGDTGNDVNTRPGYVNYGYGSALGALRHENGRLGLRCGTSVITETTYAQVTAGHARELDRAMVLNAAVSLGESYWCDGTEPLSSLEPEGENFGSPGAANSACARADPLSDSGGTSAANIDSGAISGQCIDALTGATRDAMRPQLGDLQVSEIMPAPSIGNNGPGEWFEVVANNDVDLNGLELANEGTGNTFLISDTCLSVHSGDWLLFARGTDPTKNGRLPSPTAAFDFNLADSSSSTYAERAVILRLDGTELDRATWTKSTKGVSLQRSISGLGLAQGVNSSNWCAAPVDKTFGTGDRGTPGAANTSCPSVVVDAGLNNSSDPSDASLNNATGVVDAGNDNPSAASDAGLDNARDVFDASPGNRCRDASGVLRDAVPPKVGDLEVTEVMAAPSLGNNGPGEWFEVLVNADVDLNGLELANEGTGSTLLISDSCLRVTVDDRLVFARSAEPATNGGLPTVMSTFGFTLADSSSTTYGERSVVLRYGGAELDRMNWTKSTKGASWQLFLSALKADAGSTIAAAGSNFTQACVTPSGVTFGSGDRGTPGAENVVCP